MSLMSSSSTTQATTGNTTCTSEAPFTDGHSTSPATKVCERQFCDTLPGTAASFLIGISPPYSRYHNPDPAFDSINQLQNKMPRWCVEDLKCVDEKMATKLADDLKLPKKGWGKSGRDSFIKLLGSQKDIAKERDSSDQMIVHFCSDCDETSCLKCSYECCTDCKQYFCKKLAGFRPGAVPNDQDLLNFLLSSLPSYERKRYDFAIARRDVDYESFIAFATIVEYSDRTGSNRVHTLHQLVKTIGEFACGDKVARLADNRTIKEIYKLKDCEFCGDHFCQSCGENKLPSPPCGEGYCGCMYPDCVGDMGYLNHEKYSYGRGSGIVGCGSCPIPKSYVKPDYPVKGWFESRGLDEYGQTPTPPGGWY